MPKITIKNDIKIVRPMLKFTKDEIKKYLNSQNQQWIEDPSNQDDKYKRVRIRKLKSLLDDLELSNERLSKTKNSYTVKKSFLEDIDNEKTNLPKEVIILDDVITTGSTLCSCKEILCSLGIEKIHGLSLFIVP